MSPRWRRASVSIANQASDVSLPIDLAQITGQVVRGMLCRVKDASAQTGANLDGGFPNGLVRRMWCEAIVNGRRVDVLRPMHIGLAQRNGAYFMAQEPNVSNVLPKGMIFVPLADTQSRQFAGAALVNQSSELTLHFDTESAPESVHGAVAPAAGDRVDVLILAYQGQQRSGAVINLAAPNASAAQVAGVNDVRS